MANGEGTVVPGLDEACRVASNEAAQGERDGRLTAAAVAALRSARLFSLHQPAALGGLALDLPTACRVITRVSEADGAAGWAAMIGAGPAWFAGHMDPEGARQVFGGGGAVAGSGQPGRVERATPRPGERALRLVGRWRWCSGAPWAEWFTFNALDPDGAIVTVAVPASDTTIHPETWDVRGLRATASCEVSVAAATVAPHRAFRVDETSPVDPDPLFRVPFEAFAQATMAAVPLGVARRAVADAAALSDDERLDPPAGEERAADPLARRALAGSAAAVHAAEAGLRSATEAVWEGATSGRPPHEPDLVTLRLAAVHVARTGRAVATELGAVAGMSALHRRSGLGRALADLSAAACNSLLSDARLAEVDPRSLPVVRTRSD